MGSTVTRRRLLGAGGGAGLRLLAGCGGWARSAQPPPAQAKVLRIGYVNGSSPETFARPLETFRRTLDELGYVEDQNLVIEYRWGNGNDLLLREPAAELARLPVDVFIVPSAPLA